MNISRRQFVFTSGAFFALGAFGAGFRLGKKIVIAHISDVHVSTEDRAGDIRKIVAEVNADPEIDFVVVTGDLQNRGQEDELRVAKGWYDAITKPKFVCPGNHEMQYPGSRENWAKVFGETYRKGQCGDIPVYSVDSNPPGFQTGGFFRPEEMKRLTEDLAKDGAKDAPFTVVLTHYSPTFEIANWWLLPQALRAAGIENALILSGHAHRFMSWNWLGYLGFTGRAVGANKLHRDHPSGGYVRLTVGTDGQVTGEERIAAEKTYPSEFSGTILRDGNKKTKGISSPKYKPVPPPADAVDVKESGVFAFPPPPEYSAEESKLRKTVGKELSGRIKQFGVSPYPILEDGEKLYVPGSRGLLVVIDAKTHADVAKISCGYSAICGLKKVDGGIRVELVEGRSFTLKGK